MKIPRPYYVGSVVITAIGAVYLLKDRINEYRFTGEEKLTNKVVIVTGANSGIGMETTKALAKREAKVIMACRDMKKCETVRQEIALETLNKYIYCRHCDLASQESIRKFVKRFKKEFKDLHVLINNAAVMNCPKAKTKDGIEMQLGVNYIGHFLLTNLLIDRLIESAPSRIINVTSAAYSRGKIKIDDFNSDKNYDPDEAYRQSKLANVIFTLELAKKLKGTGVTVNAVYPGSSDTEINRHLSYHSSYISSVFVKPFTWIFIQSARQGATPVWMAAVSEELKDVTGCYFSKGRKTDLSKEAENEKISKWLWLTSEKWTKLETS
ncbi:retinol dehydrogenase 13-like [Leptopilina heterotoma]|uniref:retinol dehydrogenase 13-like n=1 Tax=Leptopilina heterotoma TaxID=63436 RepID=UPI001CAA175C|nr:retinol dehydrogenase 13-like [Leptopilina heterotoma]